MCRFLQFLPHLDLLCLLCSQPYKFLLLFINLKRHLFYEVAHRAFLLSQFSGQTRDLYDLRQFAKPYCNIDVPVTSALNKQLPELD